MYYSLECFWHYIAQWLAQMHFETHTSHTPLSRIVLTIGWILLNVGMMPKILRYLIKVSTLLSNVRFSALFRRLEECTHYSKTSK